MLQKLITDQRVRFLLVGGFNTAFGYGLFVLFELTFGGHTNYLLSLYLSYGIAIVIAFVLHRRFTYQVLGRGKLFLDFIRFTSVYLVSLIVNTIALPLLVELGGLPPILAQVIVVGCTTVISYFGHKFFSFRRRSARPAAPADQDEVVDTGSERA
jgi:putative flippase GtrA